ncbi:aminobenzoyl-glutamate utilization protein A [Symbiobacterium terraclitae]|uniref:Aminobenzoyl-glutamate utilization protein A n=1 Tax=Symbiobacterium terraclitae TaxID=557451 RepID=A0ABS4JUH5_9FIRM|nr:amidohydrolase [Symbiobacterium terraclitae]MBP2018526.1 aminobenzoyl-glutamate utilization protein A [Symbiobacterium terraclitae]
MRQKLLSLVSAVLPTVVATRRDLHMYPELGHMEFRTASRVARRLRDLGYAVKVGRDVMDPDALLGLPSAEELEAAYRRAEGEGADPEFLPLMRGGLTGVVGEWRTGRPGPTLAMRFDMDCIPVAESTDPDHAPFTGGFASRHPGEMHACGHDGHTAIGLGVAEIITRIADDLCGTIRLLFQPAEEGCRGANPMAEAGVVDDVDFLLAAHLGCGVPSGHLYTRIDGLLASSKLDVTFTGIPAHAGAAPHMGHNAVLAMAQAVQGLYAISRHGEGTSRINVGVVRGGTGRNVIPADAYMQLEVRGATDQILKYMEDRARKVLEGAAIAQEVELSISVQGRGLSSQNSPELAALIAEEAAYVPGLTVHNAGHVTGGSDDFTVLAARAAQRGAQTLYMVQGTDHKAGHHTPRFDINEADLQHSLAVFALAAARICGRPSPV